MRECVLILIMPERGTRQRVKGQEFHKVSLVKPGKAQKKKKKTTVFVDIAEQTGAKQGRAGSNLKPPRRPSAAFLLRMRVTSGIVFHVQHYTLIIYSALPPSIDRPFYREVKGGDQVQALMTTLP